MVAAEIRVCIIAVVVWKKNGTGQNRSLQSGRLSVKLRIELSG